MRSNLRRKAPLSDYEISQICFFIYTVEALKNTYLNFGITENNESLWDPERPGEYREMPLLDDLHKSLLDEGEDARRVAKALRRFVSSSARSFNQPTNVNLDNKLIIFDLNDLTEEMRPVSIFIALDFIWDKIRQDKTQFYMIKNLSSYGTGMVYVMTELYRRKPAMPSPSYFRTIKDGFR